MHRAERAKEVPMRMNAMPATMVMTFLSMMPGMNLPREMARMEMRARALIVLIRTSRGSYSVAKRAEAI